MDDGIAFYLTATDPEGLPLSLGGTIHPCGGRHLRVCLEHEHPATRTIIVPASVDAGDLYARIREELRPAVPPIT